MKMSEKETEHDCLITFNKACYNCKQTFITSNMEENDCPICRMNEYIGIISEIEHQLTTILCYINSNKYLSKKYMRNSTFDLLDYVSTVRAEVFESNIGKLMKIINREGGGF